MNALFKDKRRAKVKQLSTASNVHLQHFCTDPCVWVVHAEIENPFESCELPFTWTLNSIVDAGDESDVLCNFAATVASAGCEDIVASDACIANTNCTATGDEGELIFPPTFGSSAVLQVVLCLWNTR